MTRLHRVMMAQVGVHAYGRYQPPQLVDAGIGVQDGRGPVGLVTGAGSCLRKASLVVVELRHLVLMHLQSDALLFPSVE